MTPLRVGIVGCGNIAVNHLDAYRRLDDVEVVAVSAAHHTSALEFAAKHDIDHASQDLDELLGLGLDAISVCTPHPTHEQVVTRAASAGVDVLCEKPIAVDVAAAERMVDHAERAGITLGVVFQRRWWPGAVAVRDAIDAGDLGTPMLAHCQVLLRRDAAYYASGTGRGTWAADGGGVLMTQAVHNIDLLTWFMGEPVEVSAKAGTFVLGENIEVEDTAAALITFVSGAVATLTATVAADPGLGTRITVTGSNGATVDLLEYPEGTMAVNDVWTAAGRRRVGAAAMTDLVDDVPVAEVNARLLPLHREQVADFVSATRQGRAPAVTGRDALASLRVVAAVYQSARTGRAVAVDGSAGDPDRDGHARFTHLSGPR